MKLSEAEIQVLASLHVAELENLPTTRESLENSGERYWIYKENWSSAFPSLIDKRLVQGDDSNYTLTDYGQPIAINYYAERPDLYWYYYQQFYSMMEESEAHSRFCGLVYGVDLSQEGQTDMTCLNDVLKQLNLKSGDKVLDLGCGAGGLSEYIANTTGAKVTGIDYSASAINAANKRVKGKENRLSFVQADLNSLDLPPSSYDAAISIDSIYWVADETKTISSIANALKPGGQLFILIEHRIDEGDDLSMKSSDKTSVARSLNELNLNYDVTDYTDQFIKFWPLAKKTALALREDFAKEGTKLIYDNWIREADEDYLPALNANRLSRYMYKVGV
ncbi:MAG: class I SAM-dependent methyltransferase [bacterium]